MLRRRILVLAAFSPAVLAARGARAQASITPGSTLRVPQQTGHGLPIEDVRFLRRAVRLAEAQVEAGKLAAEKAVDPQVKSLGAAVAQEQEELRQKLQDLARARGIDLQQGQGAATDAPVTDQPLTALRQASGEEVDKRFLARQLGLYTLQARMYQTEASNSPDAELSQITIAALASLRAHFEKARQLGEKYGLSANTVEAPPQY